MRAWLGCALIASMLEGAPGPGPRQVVDVRYTNGRLASREVLVDGTRHGLHQTWWPSGQPRSRAWYVGGAYHGEYRTWREDGRPYERRHYTDGREDGVQQSWDERGALYLNYEVRGGRRFGFVNAYPCAPGSMSVGRPTGPAS